MIEHIEFANAPPTVAQCPNLELLLLSKALVEATRNYKSHTKKKNDIKEESHQKGEKNF